MTRGDLALVLTLAAAAASPRPARAEAAPLSWEECVRLALRQNPDLASSRLAAQARRASYRGSFNAFLPGLSLSNAWADSSARPANRWSAQASASMNLLDAADVAAVRQAKATLTQAQAAQRLASAAARFSLRRAFAQALFGERALEVSRQIRDRRAQGARLVELRYQSGRESKGNMLRARAQLAQSEADLNQAGRSLRVNRRTLARHVGVDAYEAPAATGTAGAEPPPPFPAEPFALLSRRPDVAVQEAAVSGARAAVSSARSTLWPSLSADYARGRSGRTEFPNGAYSWSAGLTLSYPLFGGGPTSTYYAVKAAARSLDSAEQGLRAARGEALVDVEESWAGYAGAIDQVGVQQALLEAARQRNDEADIRYASGLMTYDSWEIIASDRINNERRAVDAQLDAVVAQAAWERALGKELGE